MSAGEAIYLLKGLDDTTLRSMIRLMQTLSTIHDVIRALGENDEEAGAAVGVGVKAVQQWKHRKRLPQRKYLVITEALAGKGKKADPVLWGFEAPAKAAQ